MKKLEKKLFKNIGKKLKTFATALFILESVGGILTGLILAVDQEFFFILLSVAAPIVAYVFNMFLYGFGELVDSSAVTATVSKDANYITDKDELPEL